MRVLALPSDRAGCGYYRIELPAKVLMEQESISVDVQPGFPAIREGERLIGLHQETIEAYDLVLMQRPMTDWQLEAIPLFQGAGIAVVVEIDDDFKHLHPENTVNRTVRPRHKANLLRASLLADLVTTTTPDLARLYGSHGRSMVLPNYVPSDWLELDDRERQGNVVGWAGTVATHPNDLQATHGAVGAALTATEARFRVIGRRELVRRNLKLAHMPELVSWKPMDQYPYELAKLDVGIAPLANTVFNRAKSWLKPLEMAALGVPVVMSDVGEYRRLNDLGIGILASTQRDWYGSVVALLQDESFRAEQAALGRQAVREGLTIEQNAWKWCDAWSEAIYNRTKHRAKQAA